MQRMHHIAAAAAVPGGAAGDARTGFVLACACSVAILSP